METEFRLLENKRLMPKIANGPQSLIEILSGLLNKHLGNQRVRYN